MKQLIIESIKFRNFLSYGNQFSKFDFSNGNFNLILGKVGEGKSSLFSTPPFLLYGKIDRKINQSNIINSINKKELEVIGKVKIINDDGKIDIFKIHRGISPKIQKLYINGKYDKDINLFQNKINSLLKIPIDLFFKIVFLSPIVSESFYNLKKNEREKFFDNFIDLEFLQSLKEKNLYELNLNNNELSKCSGKIELIKNEIDNRKIKLCKLETEFKNELNKKNKTDLQIDKIKNIIDKNESEIKVLNDELDIKEEILDKNNKIKERLKTIINEIKNDINNNLNLINELKDNIKKLKNFDINSSNCQKEINEKLIPELVEKIQLIKNKLKIKVKRLDKLNKSVKINKNKINQIKNKINEIKIVINDKEKENEKLNEKLDILNKTDHDNVLRLKENIDILKNDIEKFNKNLLELLKHEIIYERKIEITSFTQNILNKKFKPFVLNQIYPFLMERINFYLNFFNFPCVIYFKNKDIFFNGVNKHNFVYNNFSGGERRIINLATLFAFKDLLEAQIGIKINLLCLDEYIANLDIDELENVIPKLYELSKMKNLNIFIVSHNPNIYKFSFDNKYVIFKENGFSKIDKIKEI